MLNSFKQIAREHSVFLAFILIALLTGLLIAGNYGETGDDLGLWNYGDQTVRVYHALLSGDGLLPPGADDLPFYGPAFLATTRLGQGLLASILPSLAYLTTWHIFIFISFLAGVVALYAIALRLFTKPVALALCLLFVSQPVLWGHGFLNGKDTPLMAFFLVSLALGLRLDALFPTSSWAIQDWKDLLAKDWKTLSPQTQQGLRTHARNLLIASVVILLSSFFWNNILHGIFNGLAAQDAGSWLGRLFAGIAPNAGALPLAGYVDKAILYLQWFSLALILIWIAILFALAFRAFKGAAARFTEFVKVILGKGNRPLWTSGHLWVAAIALGFTTAVRIIGPFAGLLVFIFLLWKKGPQVLRLAIPYALITAVTTYLLWPFLWPAPVTNFIESLTLMSNFPWAGRNLFFGVLERADKLPANYLPVMLGIQLTIPALLLAALGLIVALSQLKSRHQGFIVMLLIWFLLPFVYVLVKRPPMYNNFRQFLFIIPPLLILAGFAFNWLFLRLNRHSLAWAVVAIAILPGLVGIVELHPYEYVYYNALVGGVPGAEGQFELDYWSTSLKEATEQLNQIAPQNSFVVAWGSLQIVEHYARPDFYLERISGQNYDPEKPYDYVILPLRAARDRYYFEGFPETVVISRAGVALSVVNQLNCGCATFEP